MKGYINDEDVEVLEKDFSSSNTASTSDTTDINNEPTIIVTAKKRSYGRLKKEIAEQDAVLTKEYLMQGPEVNAAPPLPCMLLMASS